MATGVVGAMLATGTDSRGDEPAPACVEQAASWTGGVTEWCGGTLVYRDHVYDDYGADLGTGSPHGTSFSKPAGDVDHAQHGAPYNAADLLTLALDEVGGMLEITAELNTVHAAGDAIVAVALDTDRSPSSGGGSWFAATGVDVASDGWDVAYAFEATASEVATNTIVRTVPLPDADFRVQAVVALADGTPMNVAFRPDDHGSWFESAQASALADGDVSAFGHDVSRSSLLDGHDAPAGATPPGYWQRMFRTAHTIGPGEGVDYAGVTNETTATFHFFGAVQPYMVFVPEGPAPHQAMLLLHGAGSGHSVVISNTNTQRVLGTELNRILISPLSRGWSNSYVDEGARDALDALADVESHWSVDPDRIFVSGYSMGGGGTLQLASWFPDRFAGAIDWVGFTGDCLNGTPLAQGRERLEGSDHPTLADAHHHFTNDAAQRSGCPLGGRGNAMDFLENLRHVPSAHLFAAADELVWANHAIGMQQRLVEAEVPHAWWFHPTAEHFTFAVLAHWQKEADYTADLTRMERPARVRYRTNSYLFVPRLDLVPDGAYWVDDITFRDPATTPAGDAVVDLTSHACPDGRERTIDVSPTAGPDPVPWVGQVGVLTDAPASFTPEAKITGTLTNVASLTIDRSDACIGAGVPVDLAGITSDGTTEITVVD